MNFPFYPGYWVKLLIFIDLSGFTWQTSALINVGELGEE